MSEPRVLDELQLRGLHTRLNQIGSSDPWKWFTAIDYVCRTNGLTRAELYRQYFVYSGMLDRERSKVVATTVG